MGQIGWGLPGQHPPSSSCVSAPTRSILQREIVAQEGLAGEESGGSLLGNKRRFIPLPLVGSYKLGPEPRTSLLPLSRKPTGSFTKGCGPDQSQSH